jgi:hypothetical protein
MPTQKASVLTTGGAGFEFHDQVAARLLIDMLLGRCSLSTQLGAVVTVGWEGRESGWLADDLVIKCQSTESVIVGLSLKRGRQVTPGAGFPDDFRCLAWEQWDGARGAVSLAETSNGIALVVGELAADVETAWNGLALQLRESRSDLNRVRLRLTTPTPEQPGAQSSATQRAIVQSLCRPHTSEVTVELMELMARVHLVSFDFSSPNSRAESQALADCNALLRQRKQSDADTLWKTLCGIAGRKRSVGGTINLSELLRELRAGFELQSHPQFNSDWVRLKNYSSEIMQLVYDEIEGLGRVTRQKETDAINDCLARSSWGIVVGPSGTGKSGLLKKVVRETMTDAIWLPPTALEFEIPALFQRNLELLHPLEETLAAAPGRCFLIVDAFERLTVKGQQLLEQLLRRIAASDFAHVSVLITTQPEAMDRAVHTFSRAGRVGSRLIQVSSPDESEINALIRRDSTVQEISFSPGIRPILRNLKTLDWVVRAIKAGATMDSAEVVNTSTLIEWLWERHWIGGADDGDLRSALLMDVATRESASLSLGVARTSLDPTYQTVLRGLERDGAIFRRNERVFFQHDLLGDWARLRVLVAESPVSLNRARDLCTNPRWHNAVRLYGLWLLETDRVNDWARLEAEARDSSDGVLRSVLLEAILAVIDPAKVLGAVWSHLVNDDGKSLADLLDRFLYVGTAPDPRLRAWGLSAQDSAAIEHKYRIPTGPQWIPLLRELRKQAPIVASLVPFEAAKVAGMFLRHMPAELSPGAPFPGRIEAAELIVQVVDELEVRCADGKFSWGDQSQFVLEALLFAAPDLPARVCGLCLQLAQRREWSDRLKKRAEKTRAASEKKWRTRDKQNPGLAAMRAKLTSPIVTRGELQPPWPDGPRRRVSDAFRGACMNSGAFRSLVITDPAAATETLLAVCIEEPPYSESGAYRNDYAGLAHWRESYPPLFSKGPFLHFLRAAPSEAIDFVVRLINFATERHIRARAFGIQSDAEGAAMPHISLTIEGEVHHWFGDNHCFEWNYWSTCGNTIVCVLQALEFWLYEQVDRGTDVASWVRRIMVSARSIAFAGVLTCLGKRHPDLLRGGLRPLLGAPILYSLDQDSALRRQGRDPTEMIGWNGSAPEVFALANAWYAAQHRKIMLRDVAVDLCLRFEDTHEFFSDLRKDWRRLASQMPADAPLRLLAERLDPANYLWSSDSQGKVTAELRWPQDVQTAVEASLKALNARALLSDIPGKCRMLLDGRLEASDSMRDTLWSLANTAEEVEKQAVQDGHETLLRALDVVCACVACLLVRWPDWVGADTSKEDWCRGRLAETMHSEDDPAWAQYGLGDLHWSSFVGECGVVLLSRDRDDHLARELLARAIVATQYSTMGRAMRLAGSLRSELGDDFNRAVTVALEWCSLRFRLEYAKHIRQRVEDWSKSREALVEGFVGRTSSTSFPRLLSLNAENRAKIITLRSGEGQGGVDMSPAIDLKALQEALGWLQLDGGLSSTEENAWGDLLEQLVDLSIERAPTSEDEAHNRNRESPLEFDYWVMGVAAHNLTALSGTRRGSGLWSRILDLGTPGHQWITVFLGAWLRGASSSGGRSTSDFVSTWSTMIDAALKSKRWASRWWPAYDLSRIIIALLGFGAEGRDLFAGDVGARLWKQMMPVFSGTTESWFRHAKVVQAFASFAAATGQESVLIAGISWIDRALVHPDVAEDEDLDDTLTEFLRSSWQTGRATIQSDAGLTKTFINLLARVSSRGSHAASTLRDQILAALS